MTGTLSLYPNGAIVQSTEQLNTSFTKVEVLQESLNLRYLENSLILDAVSLDYFQDITRRFSISANISFLQQNPAVGWSFLNNFASFYLDRFDQNGIFLSLNTSLFSYSPAVYLALSTTQAILKTGGPILVLDSQVNQVTLSKELGQEELVLGENISLQKDSNNYFLIKPEGEINITAVSKIRLNSPILEINNVLFSSLQGFTGVPGRTGLRGITGLRGPTGILGPTGYQGKTGVLGRTGLRGITGFRGPTGIRGITGLKGLTGVFGRTGLKGLTGVFGRTGLKGLTGVFGRTGLKGITGLRGLTSLRGLTGFKGTTGIRGITGLKGNTGLKGVTGPAGAPQGATGLKGVTGFKGGTGIQGKTGIRGITGFKGVTGLSNTNGLRVLEGANQTMGTANFSAVVPNRVLVSTTKVTASSRIFLTMQSVTSTGGNIFIYDRTPGASFTIENSDAFETGTVAWIIIEPA